MGYVILAVKILSLLLASVLTIVDDPIMPESSKLFSSFNIEKPTIIAVSLAVAILLEVVSFVREKRAADKQSKIAWGIAQAAGDAADSAGQAAQETRDVFKEVLRTAERIEQIELTISFALPMSEPSLATYKAELDAAMEGIHSLPDELCLGRSMGFHGITHSALGKSDKITRHGYYWMNSTHPKYPGDLDPHIRNALRINKFELALYKVPIDASRFDLCQLGVFSTRIPPPRLEPDIGIAQLFPRANPWLLTKSAGEKSRYQLQLQEWSIPANKWNKGSANIEFVRDLPGAQLFMNFGGNGPHHVGIRSRYDVANVKLTINRKPVALSTSDLIKHSTTDGHPFWEFMFPIDYESLFTSAMR